MKQENGWKKERNLKFMQAAASRMKKQRTDRDHAGKDHLGKIIRKSKVTGGRCIRQRPPFISNA